MDFSETASRGYAYKADDPRDIELKFLIKFVNSGSDNGFAIEGPTGAHSSSGCCQGFCYKVDIEYLTDPAQFRFRKEMWHVSNHTDPKTGTFTHSLANFQLLGHADYVGFGYCRYNLKDAVSTGNDAVCLELWFNPDPDTNPNDWTMIKRTIDTGGWGNDGDQCGGEPDQIGTWSMQKFRLKSNDEDGEFQIKHLSLREIDPTGSFEDTPEEPPIGEEPEATTLIQGLFKLQWDINTLRTSPCAGAGGGGGGGSAVFYSVPATQNWNISDSTTWTNTTGIGEVATNSSSTLVGKVIKQADIWLGKVGTPGATPVITCKIHNSSGTLLYTSTTTIAPNSLTTSLVKTTFDLSTNTHTMVSGDRIGVYWTGTSDTDYVVCGLEYAGSVANSTMFSIRSGVFSTNAPKDWAADLWQ